MADRPLKLALTTLGITLVVLTSGWAPVQAQDQSGNPLRLIADPSRPMASRQLTQQPNEQSSRQTVAVNTTEIPAEVRQVLFPKQPAHESAAEPSAQIVTTEKVPLPTSRFEPTVPVVRPAADFQVAHHPVVPATHAVAPESYPVIQTTHLEPPVFQKQELPQQPQKTRLADLSARPLKIASQPITTDSFGQHDISRLESPQPVTGPRHVPSLDVLLEESNSRESQKTNAEAATSGLGIESLHDSGSSNPQDFQEMLIKITTSTCVVLFLGIGFIVVAKRWMVWTGSAKATSSRKRNSSARKNEPPQFRIVSNLRLSPKSNLHLVEVEDQRMIVATDATGINSVTPLAKPFAASLDEMDAMTDDLQEEVETAETYTPAAVNSYSAKQSSAEIEADMQRKLAELLGGEAFKDVFYKNNRALA